MLSGETANTNIIFFHLTRAGIELTIYTALELEASKMEFEQTITFIWKRIKLNRGLCFLITLWLFPNISYSYHNTYPSLLSASHYYRFHAEFSFQTNKYFNCFVLLSFYYYYYYYYYILEFCRSPKSTQHYIERSKTDWLGITIMCPSVTTCLSADCFSSELAL